MDKDKLYITHSEWTADFGGAKQKQHHLFKRLPFNCCALSLQVAENPVMTHQGMIFELVNIIPWIKKHGTNPVTNEPLSIDSLIKLTFTKNNDVYSCPITFKIFNEHTHIVSIKTTGVVYCYEAIDTLNIQPKYWKDLLTDVPFTRKDIIVIQDPHHIESRDINSFHHVQHEITTVTPKVIQIASEPTVSFVTPASTSMSMHYTDSRAAMSLTSTTINVNTHTAGIVLSEEDYMLRHIPKGTKGFVQISTNYGEMNFELYAHEAPKAVYNFIQLADQGYYNGVTFHRNIPGFMLQGGDPTGTGKGGESYYKRNFNDEFDKSLTHDMRGLLSMANRGPNTNTSQFFITYKAAPHLNRKHTIFGKIISGEDVLSSLESLRVDKNDKPLDEIIMEKVIVYQNPYQDILVELRKKEGKKLIDDKTQQERQLKRKIGILMTEKRNDATVGSIGKYIGIQKMGSNENVAGSEEPDHIADSKEKKVKSGGFSNFDGW